MFAGLVKSFVWQRESNPSIIGADRSGSATGSGSPRMQGG
jgi:hypothetical protein